MTRLVDDIKITAIREMLDAGREYGRYDQVRNACLATYGEQLVARAEENSR